MSELELSKNVNSESCSPKLIINNKNQSKYNSNDFIKENCLWKSNFCPFWGPDIMSIHKLQ